MEEFQLNRPPSAAKQSGGGEIPRKEAWPYQAALPERYSSNFARYLSRGGLVRPDEDVRGFVEAQPGNRGDMARFYFFCLVLDQLEKEGISGDVAELGVYRGATATLLAKIARNLGTTAYLLDTFEGFDASDFTNVDYHQRVHFADTSLDAVKGLIGEENVRFVKGHFPGSASQLPIDARYCLVHIDCDLYVPMASALEYFYPRLVPGGFLIMHDYGSLHWDGAERAVDEFFCDKVESPLTLTDGAGSAVIRKAKQPHRSDNWLVNRRAAILERGWVSGSSPDLRELLGAGWSGPEDWGVWGVGASHEIFLYLKKVPETGILLEADVHAVLLGNRMVQEVEVVVAGSLLVVWRFEPQGNRGIRSVTIPPALAAGAARAQHLPLVRVEFRPRDTSAPRDLDPATLDERPLGLALSRIRLAPQVDEP